MTTPFNTNEITIDGDLSVLADVAGNHGNITAKTITAAQWVTIPPSGDTTGTKDSAAIQAALNTVGTVSLASAKYYINTPLTIPPYTALVGQPNSSQVSATDGGTTLIVTSGFTGLTITDSGPVTLKGAVVLLSQTFGGYSTVSEEQKIVNLMIDGSSAPSGVQGILTYGRVQRYQVKEVLISQVTGDGYQENLDTGGNQPDAAYRYRVFSRFNGGKGFVLRAADSTSEQCVSSNNGDTGVDWFINTSGNSKFYACRSEHAAGIGFGYVCSNSGNSSGGVMFVGCSTDQSALHGIQIGGTINSVVSFAHAVPVLLSGCIFKRDGQNGGSGGNFAGIYVNGYGTTSGGLVTISGCQVWPGVNDNGSGALTPNYGIWVQGGSNVGLGGGTNACAATGGTAIFDDSSLGANTINYDNSVTIGVGATGTMAINMAPNVANYQGASLTLTPPNAPANDPLGIVSAASGQRAFGMKVTGDSSDRVKWTSDGHLLLGPGNATQDVTLLRSGPGILGTDTATSLDVGAHALGMAQPREHGLVSWTFDPAAFGGNLALTNGAQYLNGIYINRSTNVTTVWFQVSTAATTATTNENFIGLVNSAGTLLNSVDVDSLFTSTGLKSASIGTTAVTPGFYWIVVVANCSGATSQVTLRASSNNSIAMCNVNQTAATSRFTGCGTGTTSLGNFPITPSSNATITSQQPLWFGLN